MKTTSARRYIVAAVFLTVAILAAGQIEQTAATVAGSLLSLIAAAVVYVTAARAEAAEDGTTRRPSVDE
jgi:hypothetical protein